MGLLLPAAQEVQGNAVTLTANLTPAEGLDAPTGAITFFDGTTEIGTAPIDNGAASLAVNNLAIGVHNITAIYSGDQYYASRSAAQFQTITDSSGYSGSQSSSVTVLSSSHSAPAHGQTVTFTANVSAVSPATGTPTGSVAFYDGTVLLGLVSLDALGSASIEVSDLITGYNNITASYSGDNPFIASADSLIQDVVPDTSAVTLTASSSNTVFGEAVTLYAAVSASSGTPCGTVTFYDGATAIGSAVLDEFGNANIDVTELSVAGHSITVAYAGAGDFASASSSTVELTVAKGNTSMTGLALIDTSSGDQYSMTATSSAGYGQTVTLAAYIDVDAPAAGIPEGIVTFFDGTSELGTAVINGNGNAFLDVSNLSIGIHTITATFAGDASFNASSSSITLAIGGSIGNFVWADDNADGVQDPTELGLGGVIVNLYDGFGILLASTLTDSAGHYLFAGLAAGTYRIQVKAPMGYLCAPAHQGDHDEADSDVDSSGFTGPFALALNELLSDIDAGLYTNILNNS